MSGLLTVRGLRVGYPGVEAVAGVDLTVEAGRITALVGESGSGKSTLAHAVLGLLPSSARVSAETLEFDGHDLTRLTEREWRRIRGRRIALIPQDPAVALDPVQPVGRQVAQVLRLHGLARGRAAREQAVELLDRAGLPDAARRARQYPHELSGGLRQRVLIAVATAARPRLLVADEPTSALDVTVQRRVLDQLEDLAATTGTAILLVTHDLAVVADRAHHVAVMAAGHLVESGPTAKVLAAPTHEHTRALLTHSPTLHPPAPATPREPSAHLEPSAHREPCAPFEPSAPSAPREPSAPSEPSALSMSSERSAPLEPSAYLEPCAPLVPSEASGGEELLVVAGLCKEFGGRVAVDGVGFGVRRGGALGLVGESGSGKTTTGRIVVGLERATAGSVRVGGVEVGGLDRAGLRELHRKVQLVYQNPYASLNGRMTVAEIIAEPLANFAVVPKAARDAEVRRLLDAVALPAALARRRPGELSGGQRQRVAIARALAPGPDLLVCDEPVSALDATVQARILDLLADLRRDLGLTYLFISHDLAVVRRVCDTVAVLREGRIVESGTAERVLTAPEHPYTRELLAAVPGGRARADLLKDVTWT
ncbi:ABC transporter ATP-binding protein [Actinocorallia sp. A-T 12471]|uniref:ABC transporter ATP-binding protein n=1 Tax=Actinocorallia sp. A-T 12471 TaxID=3089813 RepID=UPI0029D28D57|nr:ABC transporter ATP-binding protein [Actinocorallia sp. A-T 12471]MDX6744238.1 ABC transporter ATP-binding protein [Actinocorallia sp. A-T 12471]